MIDMTCSWLEARAAGELQDGEVHVWCANLEPDVERLSVLEKTISASEQKRAARFHFWKHRRRFVAGRGILRVLLGQYLGQPPSEIVFSYSKYQKPFIIEKNLEFNLSHSGGCALYAFCLASAVGVDLEKIRPITDAEGIARRFFSPSEYERFVILPNTTKHQAFFSCWTRKEAFIKALGEGLSYPLADFDVSFADGQPVRLNSIRGSEEAARDWTLKSLSPLEGFAAALAVQGQGWTVIQRHFTP